MKRSTWLFSILAVAAFVAVMAPSPAQAACSSPITIGTGFYPYYNYVTAPAAASTNFTGAKHIGRFWEPGKRPSQNEGAFTDPGWWKKVATASWYVQGAMQVGVLGCPGVPPGQGGGAASDGGCSTSINATCPPGFPNEMIIVLLDADQSPGVNGGNAYYYALRPSFYINNFPEFNMGPPQVNLCPGWGPGPPLGPGGFASFPMQKIPCPVVTTSSRVNSNTVALNFTLTDVALGFKGFNDQDDDPADASDTPCAAKSPYATITGYNICQFEGLNDPGRLATSWTCAPGPATGPGGAVLTNFQVSCADVTPPIDNDKFVAIQLRFNGGPAGGGYDSEYVSCSTRVECDPNLAQPDTLQPGRRPRTAQPPAEGKGPRR